MGRLTAAPARRLGAGLLALALLAAGACRGERPSTTAYDGPFADEVRRAIPKVERVARLQFRTPPRVEARSQAEVRAFLEQQFARETTAQELAGQVAAYKLLGLLADTLDVNALLLDLLTEQVVGFYDPATKVLYVVDESAPELRQTIIEHELIHALQDQHMDLDSLKRLTRDNDLATAVTAVIEGQAVYEQLEANLGIGDIAARLPGGWDRVRTEIRRNSTNMPLFSTAPLLLQETLLFPYLSGAEFVRRVKVGDTVPLVAHRLPMSTEQVMHPDKYEGAGDPPIVLELPAPNAGAVRYSNTLGEFETRMLLYVWLGDQAAAVRGASGWGGDRYVVFETDAGPSIAWLTVWDSAVDAGEFFDVLDTALRRRHRDLAMEPIAPQERRYTGGGRAMRLTAAEVDGRPAVLWVDVPRGGRTDALLDLARVRTRAAEQLALPQPDGAAPDAPAVPAATP